MRNRKRFAFTPRAPARGRRHLGLARQLVREWRYDEALSVLGEALAQSPRADLYDYRGVLLALAGREADALLDYAMALGLANTPSLQAQILYHRGLLYGRRHLYDLALLDVQRALRLDPCNRTYGEALGQLRIEWSQAVMPGADGADPAATAS